MKSQAKMRVSDCINQWLLDEIRRMNPGDLLPTEAQIAEKFGVSRATVQNVTKHLQQNGLIQRRKGRGTFVAGTEKTVINVNGRVSAGKLLMVHPDYPSHDYTLKVGYAEKLGRENQLELVTAKLAQDTSLARVAELARKIDNLKGIILIPPGGDVAKDQFEELDKLGIPVVVLEHFEYCPLFQNLYSVSVNSFLIGYLDIDYLVKMGHRDILFIANEPWGTGSNLVHEGMKKAIKDLGLPSRVLRKANDKTPAWADAMKTAYDLTSKALNTPLPSAIIYTSFEGAMAGYRAIREAGLEAPDDISILANATFGPLEQYFYPKLTTITCTREAQIEKAFALFTAESPPLGKLYQVEPELNPQESIADLSS